MEQIKTSIFLLEYSVEYIRKNATAARPIRNQDLDEALQKEFNFKKPLGDAHIRAIIHESRLQINIYNDEGENGWLCANVNGYFISFEPSTINAWNNSFFNKINEMMKVYQKSLRVLSERTFYKQGKLFDDAD